MRDPQRIDRMLGRLRQLWLVSPDLRLGQLVCNLTGPVPTFHMEDDEMERAIGAVLSGGWTALDKETP